MKKALIAILLLSSAAFAQGNGQWTLAQSTLTYHVSHPLHQVQGVSHAARGKGVCAAGKCDFLIAVPVKTFDSGDSNRDLHMLQVVRGAKFPIVSVRTTLPESALTSTQILVDIDVDFAGKTAHYHAVPMQIAVADAQTRITGAIPATLTDFAIDPPSLLSIAIKNEIPITVDLSWQKQ